jgi:hypothetical protein
LGGSPCATGQIHYGCRQELDAQSPAGHLLSLSDNQIVDVSGLSLPEGLKVLELNNNQIVDVQHHVAQETGANSRARDGNSGTHPTTKVHGSAKC